MALSREAKHFYVMDLIKRDANFFVDLLKENDTIMICGSLAMQKDVETILDELCLSNGLKNTSYYKNTRQLLTDCY